MNLAITRLILAFASLSLVCTMLPLLQTADARPLIEPCGRDRGLLLYSVFLCAFFWLVLPGSLAGPRRGGRASWTVTTLLILLFATIPAIFSAFISGVHAQGLACIAGIAASCAAFPLALHRLFGDLGARATRVTGLLLLVALPGVEILLDTLSRPFPVEVARLSPVHHLVRIARELEVPAPWPYLLAAVVPWAIAVLPRPGRASGRAAATLGLLLPVLAVGAGEAPQQTGLTIRPSLGGWARPGLRLSFVVRADGGGARRLIVGRQATVLPADGEEREVLLPTDPERTGLRLEGGPEPLQKVLPFRLLGPEDRLVVNLAGPLGVGPEAKVRLLHLDPEDLPRRDGALEVVDAFVVRAPRAVDLPGPVRERILAEVARGARLLVTSPAAPAQAFGRGAVVPLASATLQEEDVPVRAHPRAELARELTSALPRPRWSEVDFDGLVIFAACYHLAFFLAFLLPLLIDARKSVTVYLWSVSFVTLLVVGVAWNVLGRIFLDDNQVHVQRLSFREVTEGPSPLLIGERWECFASMSAEVRDLPLGERRGLWAYDPVAVGLPGVLVREGQDARIEAAGLDRHRGRVLLVREDARPSPLTVQREEAGWLMRRASGGEDGTGILAGGIEGAWLVENGRVRRRVRREGALLRPAERLDLPASEREHTRAVREFLRVLTGGRRKLLLRLTSPPRDRAEPWFLSVDRGQWLLLPAPDA